MVPTIREKFNTYRLPTAGCFADHKKMIDLLKRVCTVSVRTQKVVLGMVKVEH